MIKHSLIKATLSFCTITVVASLLLMGCSDVRETDDLDFNAKPTSFQAYRDTLNGPLMLKWTVPSSDKKVMNYHLWFGDSILANDVANKNPVPDTSFKATESDTILTLSLEPFLDEGILSAQQFNVTLWAEVEAGELGGEPVYTVVYVADVIMPEIVIPEVSVYEDSFEMNWIRPTDVFDVYLPESDSGIIIGYDIKLYSLDSTLVAGDSTLQISQLTVTFNGEPLTIYKPGQIVTETPAVRIGQYYRSESNTIEIIDGWEEYVAGRRLFFFIEDRGRRVNDSTESDVFSMTFKGLDSETSYKLENFTAYDESGNSAVIDSLFITLTDSTQPAAITGDSIVFIDDSSSAVIYWDAPNDLKNKNCEPGSESNDCDVVHYDLLVFTLDSDSSGASRTVNDSYIGFAKSDLSRYYEGNDSVFSDTLYELIPERKLLVGIVATDASRHKSDTVFTDTIFYSYKTADTARCPSGMIPITLDSLTSDSIEVESFCIEQSEHQDSTGFITAVTAKEAEQICSSISADHYLCREREWHRACTGRGGHEYGTISDVTFYLEEYCNIGTAQSEDVNGRSENCITAEGVRDLPGQLQEWVALDDSARVPTVAETGVDYVIKGASYKQIQETVSFEEKFKYATCDNSAIPSEERLNVLRDSIGYFSNVVYSMEQLDTMDGVRESARTFALESLSPADSLFLDSLALLAKVVLVHEYEYQGQLWVDSNSSEVVLLEQKGNEEKLDEITLYGNQIFHYRSSFHGYRLGTQKRYGMPLYNDASISFRCCAKMN
ncbi:MAG: hypothetical protein OCD01_00940 [Fibrobacterales bacterium]